MSSVELFVYYSHQEKDGIFKNLSKYTVWCYITHSKEFARNQGKRQNFDPFILPYKFGLIFMRMKQKNFFLKKKIKMAKMVVRLSDIRAKTGKKCIFWVFRLFLPICQTASRLYRLSYINALRINQSY